MSQRNHKIPYSGPLSKQYLDLLLNLCVRSKNRIDE